MCFCLLSLQDYKYSVGSSSLSGCTYAFTPVTVYKIIYYFYNYSFPTHIYRRNGGWEFSKY